MVYPIYNEMKVLFVTGWRNGLHIFVLNLQGRRFIAVVGSIVLVCGGIKLSKKNLGFTVKPEVFCYLMTGFGVMGTGTGIMEGTGVGTGTGQNVGMMVGLTMGGP